MERKRIKSLIPRITQEARLARLPVIVLAAVTVPLAYIYNGFYNVEGGHRALVFNKIFGLHDKVYGEGTLFFFPFLERVIDYNIRMQPRTIGSRTGSKDLQMVDIQLRVLFRPDRSSLPKIYRTLGMDFDARVLPSIANEVSQSVVAQYNASQLIGQRELVSHNIRERLTQRAKDFDILLGDVAITHLSFGKEYRSAVEAKQVAQQEAERAKFLVEKAEQDKLSAIIRSKGDAQSIKLIGEATKHNPSYLKLKKYETAREIARNLASSNNRLYLPSDLLLVGELNSISNPTQQQQQQSSTL